MNLTRPDSLPEFGQAPLAARPVLAAGPSPLRLAREAMAPILQLLLLWQERATQRHHLSMLDGHALRDVGLARADLAPEIGKPFWRP